MQEQMKSQSKNKSIKTQIIIFENPWTSEPKEVQQLKNIKFDLNSARNFDQEKLRRLSVKF